MPGGMCDIWWLTGRRLMCVAPVHTLGHCRACGASDTTAFPLQSWIAVALCAPTPIPPADSSPSSLPLVQISLFAASLHMPWPNVLTFTQHHVLATVAPHHCPLPCTMCPALREYPSPPHPPCAATTTP